MLYRSPITRWFLAAVGLVVGYLIAFGDPYKWRSTPSFRWLEQAPIPMQVWGAAFLAYALLLVVSERTRPVAFALGAFLYCLFVLSLLFTISGPTPKNIVAVGGLADCVVFHAYSIKTAWMLRLLP